MPASIEPSCAAWAAARWRPRCSAWRIRWAREHARRRPGLDRPRGGRARDLDLSPETTCYIIATKSGTTTETLAFLAHFWALEHAAHHEVGSKDEGDRFVAISDPGDAVEAIPHSDSFRETFPQPAGRRRSLQRADLRRPRARRPCSGSTSTSCWTRRRAWRRPAGRAMPATRASRSDVARRPGRTRPRQADARHRAGLGELRQLGRAAHRGEHRQGRARHRARRRRAARVSRTAMARIASSCASHTRPGATGERRPRPRSTRCRGRPPGHRPAHPPRRGAGRRVLPLGVRDRRGRRHRWASTPSTSPT